jgi:hypothetical protein
MFKVIIALLMESVSTFETSIYFYETILRHIPECPIDVSQPEEQPLSEINGIIKIFT